MTIDFGQGSANQMRILAINAHGMIGGGASKVYVRGNQLLAEKGHSVAWLNIGPVQNNPAENQPAYSIPDFAQGSQMRKQIGLAIGYLYNRSAYRLAERALHEFRPDVVHVHNIQGQISPSVLLPFRKQAVPIVQTLHDYRLLCPAIHFLSQGKVCEACKGKKYYQCALKRCRKGELVRSSVAALGSYVSDYFYQYDRMISAYIAPSEFMRAKMIAYGYTSEKIHVLPNAYFETVPVPQGRPREHILFAGRLSPEKGIDLLVQAAKGLDAAVVIAGDGPEREHLQALAGKIGAGNVSFPGFLNATDLNRLYQTALVTVLPSRWYENGPLVILESYANATPMVGARIGAIPEFVTEGKTGFLFTPEDAADLHLVLENSIHQPGLLQQMGTSALADVAAKYSPAAYLEGLEDILSKVVKGTGHANCEK